MFDKIRNSSAKTGSDSTLALDEAILRVLESDGPMTPYGAPAAVIGRKGKVLTGNPAARGLTAAMGRQRLQKAVEDTLAARQPVTETVQLDTEEGAGATFEISILPISGGDRALLLARDLSKEQSLRDALVDSRRRYKDLVELSSDFAWETDADGRFNFVSPQGALGYDADELVRHRPVEFLDSTVQYIGTLPFGSKLPVSDVDVWFRRREGESRCLLTSAVPIFDDDRQWIGTRGICRDVTDARRRDTALALAQTRKQLLAHVIRSVREEIDPGAMLMTAATETARALGGAHSRVYRLNPKEGFEVAAEFGAQVIAEDLEQKMLSRTRDALRTVTAIEFDHCIICAPTIYQKRINGALLIVRDSDVGAWDDEEHGLADDVAGQLATAFEQIQNHAKLEELSRTDELTGLLNRRAFFSELRERLAQSAAGALFFVDLDNFKLVNDVHGHQRGDEALVAVAELLNGFTRPGDLVSRFGGDEFALWLERIDAGGAANRAEDLLRASNALREYSGDADRPVGLSVGVAVHEPAKSAETVTELTDRADAAMYRIKHGTKGGYVIANLDQGGATEATG